MLLVKNNLQYIIKSRYGEDVTMFVIIIFMIIIFLIIIILIIRYK